MWMIGTLGSASMRAVVMAAVVMVLLPLGLARTCQVGQAGVQRLVCRRLFSTLWLRITVVVRCPARQPSGCGNLAGAPANANDARTATGSPLLVIRTARCRP